MVTVLVEISVKVYCYGVESGGGAINTISRSSGHKLNETLIASVVKADSNGVVLVVDEGV